MELKEFIKTAITDITEAVSELQEELKNGTIVNPSLTQGEHGITLGSDNPSYPDTELEACMVADVYKVVFHMKLETL